MSNQQLAMKCCDIAHRYELANSVSKMCADSARSNYYAKDYKRSIEMSVRSLRESVGIFHESYLEAVSNASQYRD